MSKIREKMLQQAIVGIREFTAECDGFIQRSRFNYDRPIYRNFFDQVIVTTAYIEQQQNFSENDDELKKHLQVLQNGVSPLAFQIQLETSKNWQEGGEGAAEHNKAWNSEIHKIKNILNGLTGSMGLAHSSIQIMMKYADRSAAGTGVPIR